MAEPTPPMPDVREAVVFVLAGQRYALPITAVQEIQQIVAMNEVPETVRGVVGMINLRGDVIPAIDLRRALGIETAPYQAQTPMVIARVRDSLVALIVDEVEDVSMLPDGCLQHADAMLELADRLIGLCRLDSGLVFLLDPDRLLPDAKAKAAPRKRTRKKAE